MKQYDETVYEFFTRSFVDKFVDGLKNGLIQDRKKITKKLRLPEALKIAIAKAGTAQRKNLADIKYI
jgi:hypothetical protein